MPTVLVVDDEQAILRAIERTLRREPYEVVTINSFAKAVTQLSELRPEVLLTDFRMPEGTGLDLAKHAKELDPNIYCVLLTGCSDEESGRQLISSPQVDEVLLKPWHNEELRLVVRGVVEKLK
jgi:response regulator RpfG family c-di-GMP phosphodiesterase